MGVHRRAAPAARAPRRGVVLIPGLLAFAQDAQQELPGLSGWVASVIESLGEVGVFFLVALENLFPPIPSEVVLPFAGFLANQDRLSLVGAIVAATLGAAAGAQVLYELGRRLGVERLQSIAGRIPLVEPGDLDRGVDWFDEHGQGAVFSGRLLPGIRSLVSVPAGAREMGRIRFLVLTLAGSAIWNAALVMGGYALGSSWQRAQSIASWVNVALVVAMVAVVARWAWSKWRLRRDDT